MSHVTCILETNLSPTSQHGPNTVKHEKKYCVPANSGTYRALKPQTTVTQPSHRNLATTANSDRNLATTANSGNTSVPVFKVNRCVLIY
ncbi:hypothetical protein GN956_G26655 [Arapaima gigas]